jgi:hypothetical protein
MRILYSSSDVRAGILDVFSKARGRRVAIAAFVGVGAESYLPNLKLGGLELYCWPKAGGTNPDALRLLRTNGAKIFFVDSLHMKLYWSRERGAVITSANLSTNALGAGDLKEFGVRLRSAEIDIDRVVRSLRARPMSRQELLKLDREHTLLAARARTLLNHSGDGIAFPAWYSSPLRRDWKLGWWSEEFSLSKATGSLVKNAYSLNEPDCTLGAKRGNFVAGDWILNFRLLPTSVALIRWMCVDHVVPVPKSDKNYDRQYPCEVIQAWPLKRYPPPPFRNDQKFRNALKRAVKTFGYGRLRNDDGVKTPKDLLKLIRAEY